MSLKYNYFFYPLGFSEMYWQKEKERKRKKKKEKERKRKKKKEKERKRKKKKEKERKRKKNKEEWIKTEMASHLENGENDTDTCKHCKKESF